VQGVVDGGRDPETSYGGNGDYLIHFDLQRMGLLPGALIKFRAESRYGESVNAAAGPILPVNTDAFSRLTDQLDESIPFTITDLPVHAVPFRRSSRSFWASWTRSTVIPMSSPAAAARRSS
jgi:hypothetical protein